MSGKNIIKNKGFMLVELMMAIFLLSLGITAGLYFLSKSLGASSFNRDYLIASELSREGIELIRNIRDINWETGDNFNKGFKDAGTYCVYVFEEPAIKKCDYPWDELRIVPDPLGDFSGFSGFYMRPPLRQNWGESRFYRYLEISYPDYIDQRGLSISQDSINKDVAKIVSVVGFKGLGRTHEVKLIEYLYDWLK